MSVVHSKMHKRLSMTMLKYSHLPPEIINHIFCYCEGSTNKTIKKYIDYSLELETGMIGLKRINSQYGFVHLNITRLDHAICYRCPVCKNNLWSNQYIQNINYQGQRMCSYTCLNEYEAAMTLLIMKWM